MDKKPSTPSPAPYAKEDDCCDLYGEYCYPCKEGDSSSKKKESKH